MIILEGPDGAGKTQLALRLADDLGIEVEPRVVDHDMSTKIPLAEWALQQMARWPRPIIYDRFTLISEFVYGPIFRDSVREGFDNLNTLTQLHTTFKDKMPTVVYCLPPLAEVMANVENDDLNEEAKTRIQAVYWLYLDRLAADPHALFWDYTQHHSYNSLVQRIKAQAWRNHHLEY